MLPDVSSGTPRWGGIMRSRFVLQRSHAVPDEAARYVAAVDLAPAAHAACGPTYRALRVLAGSSLHAMLKRLHLPTIRCLDTDLAVRAEAEGMGYRVRLDTMVREELAHRAEAPTRSARRQFSRASHHRRLRIHLPK